MNIVTELKSKFKFDSLIDFMRAFDNQQICIEALEWIRWRGRRVSPFDHTSYTYVCKNGRYKCKNTGKYFNVLTGTIFENTKIPLNKWFVAIFLLSTDNVGISTTRLMQAIGVTKKTAWYMLHKIRMCMACENDNVVSGVVEADEAYIYGVNRFKHLDKKIRGCQGKSMKGKNAIFGVVQREGKLNMRVVKNTNKEDLEPVLQEWVEPETTLYTDESPAYNTASEHYSHSFVKHKSYNYADGDVTTNHIENKWKHLKRRLKGGYLLPRGYHLQKYVNEHVYVYNTRGESLLDRVLLLLENAFIRITYNEVVHGY